MLQRMSRTYDAAFAAHLTLTQLTMQDVDYGHACPRFIRPATLNVPHAYRRACGLGRSCRSRNADSPLRTMSIVTCLLQGVIAHRHLTCTWVQAHLIITLEGTTIRSFYPSLPKKLWVCHL